MNDNAKLRIVVVGGVAGGATAAARARRTNEDAEITVLERSGYASFANCGMPYFLSGDIRDSSKLLLATPESFQSQYRVDVRLRSEVTGIDRAAKTVTVRGPEGTYALAYDRLILAQGAAPIRPAGWPENDPRLFTLRQIEDMLRLDDYLRKALPAHAAIVGGGFIGLEMAEALTQRGLAVTVVEKMPRLFPALDPEMGRRAEAALTGRGVRVRTGVGVREIGNDHLLLDGGERVRADVVLWAAGVAPEAGLAKAAGLAIGALGGVSVDEEMRTSDPSIYAVGDMAEVTHFVTKKPVRIPLAGPANRQARAAGTNAAGGHLPYRGALGSAVLRLFDQTLAFTGLGEDAARKAGFDAATARVHAGNHPGYFPGASVMHLAVVYDKTTRRLLGAQAIGGADVEKRIDVVATALFGGLAVEDLESLDLAYAPPYNSANDPLNVAAFTAGNDARGFAPVLSPAALDASRTVLDVRNPDETAKGHWPRALQIPLPELRARLGEIPAGAALAVVCAVGRRGHLATRILRQAGFDAVNVSGGWNSLQYEYEQRRSKGEL